MEHPDLWSSTPEAPPRSRDRWLAGIHAVAQWAARTPEFTGHVATSVTSGRNGSAFDQVLCDRFTANPTGWRPRDIVGLGHVDQVRWGRPRFRISAADARCVT
ncbi:MAG: hypothetical protein WBF71_13025 [Microthrixaceae bacterium]